MPVAHSDARPTIAASSISQQRLEESLLARLKPAEKQEAAESRMAQVAALRPHHDDRFNNGRLVDSIAEPLLQQQAGGDPQQQDKLNYIIDFLRQNKLTKFCDLLQNGDVQIRELVRQLNSMKQFTLFVPTNEALLLMSSSQLGSIEESPDETRQFLMAHATGELVIPRLTESSGQSLGQLASKYSPAGAQNRWSSGRPLERIVQPVAGGAGAQTLLYSLAGSPLRIITTPMVVAASQSQTPAPTHSSPSTIPSTRLELIVNGANVLSGHSHALQEPNNTSITYAIVHLVDRPLYPVPKTSLFERIQQVAPKFARLIQNAQDQALVEQLNSGVRSQQLTTGFVPNDDALRSIPTKLLDQLETNRTFLQHFLRTHLVDGLFYSGQLAAPLDDNSTSTLVVSNSMPRQLTSMSGVELEFETKVIQSRQLILVNSIPIIEQDQTVLNGVLHVIVRPIFEKRLLDVACNCESSKQIDNNQQTDDLLKRLASERHALSGHFSDSQLPTKQRQQASSVALSNWFQNAGSRFPPNLFVARNELGANDAPTSSNNNPTELEREESRLVNSSPAGKIVRTQRSDNLVARNNRDFYRPSAAPVNLALQPEDRVELSSGDQLRHQPAVQNAGIQQTSPAGLGRGFIGSLEPDLANMTYQNEQLTRANQQQQRSRALANAQKQPPVGDLAGASASQTPDSSLELRAPVSSFEVERYKIVMDANMRQKLREQQQHQHQAQVGGLIMSSILNRERPSQPADVFAYDQPMATPASLSEPQGANPASRSGTNLWTYSAQPPSTQLSPESNQTQLNAPLIDQVSSSASTQRHQRLLKFQAEDARDGSLAGQAMKTSSQQQFGGGGGVNSTQLQRLTGKTAAPPFGANFMGCAFYDTECKRLQMGGKFVRLPARLGANKSAAQSSLNQTNANQQANFQPTTPSSIFDSSFGETTVSPYVASTVTQSSKFHAGTQNIVSPPQGPSKNYISFNPPGANGRPRVSPLNQPLPPWSADEHTLIGGGGQPQNQQQPGYGLSQLSGPNVNWRAQEMGDLSRIKLATGKLQQVNLTTSAGQQQQQSGATAGQPQQVLLIPVEMFQDSNISISSGRQKLLNQTSAASRPIYFAPPSGHLQATGGDRAQQRPPPPVSGVVFSSNSQYFTPTVHTHAEPSPSADRRPAPSFGRLTNFTTLDNGASEGFDSSSSAPLGASKKSPSSFVLSGQKQRENQPRPIHTMNEEHRLLNESFQSAIQHARKIVRLQTSPYQQQPDRAEFNAGQLKGDISITSAKLTKPANLTAGGLAVQASNQAPDVSGPTLARPPLGLNQQLAGSAESALSQDFFQNRTIAEIMDDSGLRIDGQQVTFSRLRDCLDQADLSNLIVQQGSALTIFMPTDTAFQRLVQQQALMQQRPSWTSNTVSILSSRLTDPNRRHLIPLVARVSTSRPDARGSEPARLQADPSADSSSLALAQRLTLDCSTQQVRQLLLDHLSAQLITPKQLQRDLVLSSLSGKRLLLSSVPSKKIVVVDGQPVIAATRAKNGMVYVVNKFLNISQQVPNVIDLLESQPNLKTFQSYLAFSSLTDRLKRETGPITIMAPTNEAFDQLSSAARQLLNSDPAAMMDILRGHIIEGAQFGKLISMRNRLKTMNSDHFIEAKVIKPNIYQLDNQMTSMRLVGTSGNGVVNMIDRLIVPPWLRVSSGATSGGSTRSSDRSFNELDVDSRGALPSSVLDAGTTTLADGGSPLRQSSVGLNLPLLNNRPLRFEQPTTARLAPTNSFLLAGGTTTSTISPDSPDGFDVSPQPAALGSQFEPTSRPDNDSPFLRIFNNTTHSGSSLHQMPAGARLPSDFATSSNSLTAGDQSAVSLTSNSTKNMRLIEKLAGLIKAGKFVKYLVRSRLSELLKPDMNYVILVPTDQAIDRLPKQIIDVLDRDPDRLSDLVNFHVLDTTFEYINTIPDGQTLNTLNEKDILFNWHRNNTILTASGAVVLGGIQEENIALLIVDRVLYPTPGDLLSIVTKSPILSNFTNLIKNAGLERQLSLAGPFTLFAPSDFAFNQLDKRDFDFLQNNRESARRFLLRHLSQPAIFTSSIALSNSTEKSTTPASASPLTTIPFMSVTNSLGEDLILRQKNDYFSVNDVNFSYADVAATNGVVHVIDGLL